MTFTHNGKPAKWQPGKMKINNTINDNIAAQAAKDMICQKIVVGLHTFKQDSIECYRLRRNI